MSWPQWANSSWPSALNMNCLLLGEFTTMKAKLLLSLNPVESPTGWDALRGLQYSSKPPRHNSVGVTFGPRFNQLSPLHAQNRLFSLYLPADYSAQFKEVDSYDESTFSQETPSSHCPTGNQPTSSMVSPLVRGCMLERCAIPQQRCLGLDCRSAAADSREVAPIFLHSLSLRRTHPLIQVDSHLSRPLPE